MGAGPEEAEWPFILMVMADSLAYADLMAVLVGAEQSLGRPINPSIYSRQQFSERLESQNAFVSRVMEQPRLWIKGVRDDAKSATESGESEAAKA